jgi:hypothetical protein
MHYRKIKRERDIYYYYLLDIFFELYEIYILYFNQLFYIILYTLFVSMLIHIELIELIKLSWLYIYSSIQIKFIIMYIKLRLNQYQ